MSGRPDLSDREAAVAYRAELRRVAWPIRTAGFVLVLLGALYIGAVRYGWFGMAGASITIGYGLLAVGWALFICAIALRTRYHRRRMAEPLGGAANVATGTEG